MKINNKKKFTFQQLVFLFAFSTALITNSCTVNKYTSQKDDIHSSDLGRKGFEKKAINTIESGNPNLIIPLLHKLTDLTIDENFAKPDSLIAKLKDLIIENIDNSEIKDPALQALTQLDGDSLTFDFLSSLNWKLSFYDSGKVDWKRHWTLDGKKAIIKNTNNGMYFYAGPVPFEDESHAVLWTKDYFLGDLNIEYDYTRLDDQTKFVNILYIQATGSEKGIHSKDIMKWSSLRNVAAMNKYFSNMHIYHVSYAAFNNKDNPNKPGYIRARRYMAGPLKGTELMPDYRPDGLFATNVPHHIHVIKTGRHIFMKINGPGKSKYCHWYNNRFPPITEGYVGLRHMCTRGAKYADFKISLINN